MLFCIYFLLLAGTGFGVYPPCSLLVDVYFLKPSQILSVISTTELLAIRLGHAVANSVSHRPGRQTLGCVTPERTCKGHPEYCHTPAHDHQYQRSFDIRRCDVPEDRFSLIQITYHKITPPCGRQHCSIGTRGFPGWVPSRWQRSAPWGIRVPQGCSIWRTVLVPCPSCAHEAQTVGRAHCRLCSRCGFCSICDRFDS
jgi:hypothetical protein